jgi:hypothetical protein
MLQEIDTQKQQLWKRSIASTFDSRIRRPFPAVALHLSIAISCGRPLVLQQAHPSVATKTSWMVAFSFEARLWHAMLKWQATGVQITSRQVYQG